MDGLFNFPQQTFMYVHDVRLITFTEEDQASQESDDDGMPLAIVKDEVPIIKAYVALPNPRREGHTERMDAVCRLPGGTVVDENLTMIDVLENQPRGIMPGLVGLYEVFQVRPNPMDIRVLLKRPKNRNAIDRGIQPIEDDPYGD